jgi:heme O synthase-like polyprenyltransferase
VCGVLSVLLLGLVTGIPAILMGRTAIRDIDASDGQIAGRRAAVAGVVLGIVGSVIWLIGWSVLLTR